MNLQFSNLGVWDTRLRDPVTGRAAALTYNGVQGAKGKKSMGGGRGAGPAVKHTKKYQTSWTASEKHVAGKPHRPAQPAPYGLDEERLSDGG